MIRLYDNKSKVHTPWLSNPPKSTELKRMTIDQLLALARRKRGLKAALIDFIDDGKKIPLP